MLQPVSLARSTSLPRRAGSDSSSTVRASERFQLGKLFRDPRFERLKLSGDILCRIQLGEQSLLFVTSGTYDIDKRQYQHKSYNKRSGYND